jgi:uncharacterized protein (TIGR03437 family)
MKNNWRNPSSTACRVALLIVLSFVIGLAIIASTAASDERTLVVVSAASFENAPVAPESIVAAFGAQLATQTVSAASAPLPIELGGTTVEVNGRRARLFFVSPTQINFLMPAETEIGAASVTVRAGDGTISTGTVEALAVAPAIFTNGGNGRGAPAGSVVRGGQDGARVLVFYLSGIRRASDPNGDGNLDETVKVVIGGEVITPLFAGAQSEFAGLDQINVELPRHLAGRGRVNVAVTANGASSNLAEIEIAAPGAAPPQISGFTPATALAGQTLVINGSGFAPNLKDNVVRIGGVEARVIAAYESQLQAIAPFGAATGAVTVRTPDGEGASANALTVRASLSGFVEDSRRQPAPGATVRVVNRNITAVTNAEGFFLLADVPPGSAIVEVDGASVPTLASFPKITFRASVAAGRDNQLPHPIALQPATGAKLNVGGAGAATTSSASVATPSGNVTFELPGNATAVSPDGDRIESLSLTLVDESRLPAGFPTGHFSSVVAQIAPIGAVLSPGGKLIFPNTENWPAGAQAKLFRLDQRAGNRFDPATISPTLGAIVESGVATASADGRRVETARDAIKEATCYFAALPQQTTTVTGRVVESDGATPVRQAIVIVRGQEAATDGNGGFTVRNVPVKPGEPLTVEVSFLRPTGRIDRALRNNVLPVIAGNTEVTPEITLPAETSNRPPVIFAPTNLVANQGETRDFDFVAGDPDTDQTIQVSVAGAAFAAIKPAIGPNPYRLSLSPGPGDLGRLTLTLTATDSAGASATRQLTVAINRPPVTEGQAVTTDEDTPKNIALAATDADGDAIRFVVVNQPAHGRVSESGSNLSYRPAANYNGVDSFTFKAIDGFGESAVARVTIAIRPVNDPPVLTAPPALTAITGGSLVLNIVAADPDVAANEGQTLTFSATGLPGSAQFTQLDDTRAQFNWTPGEAQTGAFTVAFKVSDDGAPALSDTKSMTITTLGRWSATGAIEGGVVHSLFSDGANLFAGTGSGVLRSTDQGQSWTAASAGLPNFDVVAFAAVGSNLFAGGCRLYRSSDQGRTWSQASAGIFNCVNSFAIIGETLFAGAYNAGVYRSTDQGRSWTLLSDGLTDRRIVALLASGSTIFAGADGGGVFRSTDEGRNWTAASNGLTGGRRIRAFAALGANIFASTDDRGVFLSTDQGQNWKAVNSGITEYGVATLFASGANIFAGTYGGRVFRSTDQGQNWVEVSEGLPGVWVKALAAPGGKLFSATNGGGVYRLGDDGRRWTAANNGVAAMWARALAVKGNVVFAGMEGGGLYRSTNLGRFWAPAGSGVLPPYVNAFLVSGANLFAGTNRGVFVSTDDGRSWAGSSAGLPYGVSSLAAIGSNLFAGAPGRGVYISTDQGRNWAEANTGLTNRNVTALAAPGSNLFAGTDNGGVFRSSDNGRTWSAANEGLTSLRISSLAVMDSDLFAATYGGGVYISSNQGQSWTRLETDVVGTFVDALAVSGMRLYAANGGGVYLSLDLGRSWMRVNSGLTNLRARAFAVGEKHICVGTLGGGVFVSSL